MRDEMGRREAVIKGLKAFKRELNRDFSAKIILFGSMAKGKPHKDSDIDLIIVSPKFRGMNFFKRGARMYDYWRMRYPVDFLCYTPEEFEKLRRQITIVREALKGGQGNLNPFLFLETYSDSRYVKGPKAPVP